MPCWFCIAAVGLAATVIVPALVDRTEASLRSAAEDLRRVKETQSMVMWTGTFRFTTPAGEVKTAATTVTIYKASKRARIQCLTHDLPHDDVHALQDFVANLIGATVLDRTDGITAGQEGPVDRVPGASEGRLPAAEPGDAERRPT